MKMLVFPGSRADYLTQSQGWSEKLAKEKAQVEELFQLSSFAYRACGNQEVYKVTDEGLALYEELKPMLKSWVMSQDPEQYRMSRMVTAW